MLKIGEEAQVKKKNAYILTEHGIINEYLLIKETVVLTFIIININIA